MPPPSHGSIGERAQCLLGMFVFALMAYGVGRWRAWRQGSAAPAVSGRLLFWGFALQFIFALVVLRTPQVLEAINATIDALLGFTRAGARVVFGNLAESRGSPVSVTAPGGQTLHGYADNGAYFAFFVLPTIIFFSALTAIAYYSGVMQLAVQGLAWVMSRSMRTSGAETLSAAANIFVGQTEAPLLIKPFLAAATNSELMCVMVAGFANIASGVLGLYTVWLMEFIPNVGGHLAAACFISAPASLLVSKLMVPETQTPATTEGVRFRVERLDANLVDAAAR